MNFLLSLYILCVITQSDGSAKFLHSLLVQLDNMSFRNQHFCILPPFAPLDPHRVTTTFFIFTLDQDFSILGSSAVEPFSTTIWVSPNGSNTSESCGSTRDIACDILKAIQISVDGDVLLLIQGNYTTTNILVDKKSITIQAELTGEAIFRPPPLPPNSDFKPYDYVVIFANSTTTVRGIQFVGSRMTAIKVLGVSRSKMVFESCSFTNNIQPMYKDYTPQVMMGGAVYAEGGVEFVNCSFNTNAAWGAPMKSSGVQWGIPGASAQGGAVAVFSPCDPGAFKVTFNNCTFQNNIALPFLFSGAEFALGASISFYQLDECIQDYRATKRFLIIENSSFDSDTLVASVSSTNLAKGGTFGGASVSVVSEWDVDVTIRNCNFSNSKVLPWNAGISGGNAEGSFVRIELPSTASSVNIDSCVFVNGSAKASSSSDFVSGYGGHCKGGALFFVGSCPLNITRCSFENNACNAGDGGASSGLASGGAVYIRADPQIFLVMKSSYIHIEDCLFKKNRLGVNLQTILGSSTLRSVTPLLGGAIAIDHFRDFDDPVAISRCRFLNNAVVAAPSGGAVGGAVSFRDETQRSKNGSIRFLIQGSIFEDNKAVGGSHPTVGGFAYGGAVAVLASYDSQNNIVFLNSSFERNYAISGSCGSSGCRAGSAQGGALYFASRMTTSGSPNCISCKSILLGGCSFRTNSVGLPNSVILPGGSSSGFFAGGAIYVDDEPLPILSIQAATFYANSIICAGKTSTCAGGAIYSSRSVIEDSTLTDNVIKMDAPRDDDMPFATGGTISSRRELNITNCVFRRNSVRVSYAQGGTIFAAQSLIVVHSTFMDMSLAGEGLEGHGGAIYFLSGASTTGNQLMQLEHVQITNAMAKSYGGGIFVHVANSSNLIVSMSDVQIMSCSASYGGAIAFDFPNTTTDMGADLFNMSMTIRKLDLFTGSARNAGGAVYIQSTAEKTLDLLRSALLNNPSARFGGNKAVWGADWAAPPIQLRVIRPPPHFIWPGEKFNVFLGIFDPLDNLAVLPEATVAAAAAGNSTFYLKTGFSRDSTGPNDMGVYKFSHTSILTTVGSDATIQFMSTNLQNVETSPIHVISCPPGYFLPSPEATECARCPPFTYSLGKGSSCEPCLSGRNRKSPFLVMLDFNDTDTETTSCLVPPEDSQEDIWEITEGFYPTSTSSSPGNSTGIFPTRLMECPNPDACLGFSCSLFTQGEEWRSNCSSCISSSSNDCHCRQGYTDRLCTRCVCDPSSTCWFQDGGDDFECKQCKTPSTAALVAAIVVLQVSLTFFLVSKRSAIALFIAEAIVVFIFIILGLSEWFFVDLFVVLGIMLLISQSSNRSKHRHADETILEESGKEENNRSHHYDAAEVAGIVKIFLFWAQTTTAVIPSTAWPHWFRNFVEQLSSITLRVSGLECFAPSILSNPVTKFGFLMAMPWLLSISLFVAASFAWVVKKLKLKRGLSNAVRRLCGIPERSRMYLSDAEGEALLSEGTDSENTHQNDSDPSAPPPHRSTLSVDHNPLLAKIQYCILFLLFASHFELCISVLKVLKPCQDGYMVSLPWISCDASSNSSYRSLMILGYICLFLYLIGIPALFGALLLRNRRRLHEPQVEAKYGFLYESYKPEVYWFELIWLARRIVLSIVIVLVPENSVFRIGGVITMLIVSAIIQRRWRPFSSNFANNMDLLATVCIIYSLAISRELTHWFQTATDVSSFGASATAESLQTIIFIVNLAVVCILIGAIVIPALKSFALRFECCRVNIARIKRRFKLNDSESKLLESD